MYKLGKLIKFENDNYVLVENKFSRNRKMSFKDVIYYITGNKSKTSVLKY
jgi:hypothetical protein